MAALFNPGTKVHYSVMAMMTAFTILRSPARHLIRWVLAVTTPLALLTCGGHNSNDDRTYEVASVPGATCGEWRVESDRTGGDYSRLSVSCAEGMDCVGWVQVYPEREIGNHFGRCLPTEAQSCDSCPPPFGTVTLLGGECGCYLPCETHADCPSPWQVCEMGTCMLMPCGTLDKPDGTPCSYGSAHCWRAMCVPDGSTGV